MSNHSSIVLLSVLQRVVLLVELSSVLLRTMSPERLNALVVVTYIIDLSTHDNCIDRLAKNNIKLTLGLDKRKWSSIF